MDELEKVRKKVERQKDEIHCGGYKSAQEHSCDDCMVDIYQDILSIIDSMQKESVSEDLKEAAKDYAGYRSVDKAEGFLAGANWQKQQMMKDAVEAVVQTNSMSGNTAVVHLDCKYKAGDKVRVIIIKDE